MLSRDLKEKIVKKLENEVKEHGFNVPKMENLQVIDCIITKLYL